MLLSLPPSRWINRDPIESDEFDNMDSNANIDHNDEDNPVNLYSFVYNNPFNRIDLLPASVTSVRLPEKLPAFWLLNATITVPD